MFNTAVPRRVAPLLLLAALLGAGCGERAEPLGALEQQYPVRVEGGGDRPVVVEARPERIVVLDAGAAEILLALGAGERLVGVPAGIDGAPGEARRVVQTTGHIEVDDVVSLEPDLIVATRAVDQIELGRAERESGAVAYVQPAASVDDVVRGAIELGDLTGNPARARRLAGSIRRQVGELERRLAGLATVPVFVDTGFLITVAERSLLGDLVRRARGRSVAPPSPGPEPFEPCAVVDLDPEVVLVAAEPGVGAGASTFRECPTATELRIERVPPELVLRPGPHVPEALREVADALHPDALG